MNTKRWAAEIVAGWLLAWTALLVGLPFGTEAQAADAPGGHPGLAWVFFNDTAMNRPHSVGVDAQIDMDTGTEINDFAKVWAGAIAAPIQGPVTFMAEADNGLRLWVGGKLVIDGWAEDGVRQGVYAFDAPGCAYGPLGTRTPLRIEFFQLGGSAHLRLYWRWDGHPQELIPASCLWHTDEDVKYTKERAKMVQGTEATPLENAKARIYLPGQKPDLEAPLHLKRGPHLFIDDLLIESSENVRRIVNVPKRDPAVANPIVTGKEDGCFQPYMTIIRDPQTRVFRLWYGCQVEDLNPGQSHIGYIESDDGVHWKRPARLLDDPGPIQFGVSVIDRGSDYPHPAQRFSYGWWKDGGLRIAVSPDGLAWTPLTPGVVLRHNHDINSIFFDPLRNRYVATISVYRPGGDWPGNRRITMQSHSTDLLAWADPHYVVLPDKAVDQGETQFYAMEGYLFRGDLTIGMVKVLRDDLKADDPPDPPEAYGVGYTTLAWTRDGETWFRDPVHFFDPHPEKGVWDHAHAWIDEQVLVDDEVFLYYGGYARGHKVNRFEERQIGLVKIQRDRYVAREAAAATGRIRTPLLRLDGDNLALNADAEGGAVRVQILDAEGQPLQGFTFEDCAAVTANALDAPMAWQRPLAELKGAPVRLEFSLTNARLFAFGLS